MSPRQAGGGIQLGGDPRVNLLPPEVYEREKARKSRRLLGVLVVLALVVVAGGYGIASLNAVAAANSLTASNQKTAVILEQTQKYSSVEVIAQQVAAIQSAQTSVTSGEVLWPNLISQVKGLLLPDTTLAGFDLTIPAPGGAAQVSSGPLDVPHVASAMLILNSTSIKDMTTAVGKMSQITGYLSADVTSVSVPAGGGSFDLKVTLELGTNAVSGRFAGVGATGNGTADGDGTPSGTASPTPLPTSTGATN